MFIKIIFHSKSENQRLKKVNRQMQNSRLKVSRVQFDPRQFATQYASERDIMIWKQIFDTFDTDMDGVLAPRDLLQAMSKYNGYHPKRNYIYQTMAMYDTDESGNIDFREFVKMIHQKPYEKDKTEDINRVFEEVDSESKGFLTADDLRNLAIQLKEELPDEEIKIIMSKLDPRRTGKISLEAFLEFNRQKIF